MKCGRVLQRTPEWEMRCWWVQTQSWPQLRHSYFCLGGGGEFQDLGASSWHILYTHSQILTRLRPTWATSRSYDSLNAEMLEPDIFTVNKLSPLSKSGGATDRCDLTESGIHVYLLTNHWLLLVSWSQQLHTFDIESCDAEHTVSVRFKVLVHNKELYLL